MQQEKRILVICGTGVATSTVVATKTRDYLEEQGIPVKIHQGKVADLLNGEVEADLIIATTEVPSRVKVPTVSGVPFLTGIGLDATLEEIRTQLTES